ncbi:hypothetical protein [Acidicapsa ligni]|uniref:hypothetical protein n=1 Tax=Acidicapsa ligni TaxID=542300 RepID=UPI0021DFA146|nr:hypothetical protein [Acidicapsa ligni]
MSLLQLQPDTINSDDASSHGEDYAKGSGHLIWTTIIAFVVLSLGIALFLVAIHKPPVAAGEVTQVWVHPVHTITTPTDANGVQSTARAFDQVLVFANIHLVNQSDQPIVLKEMLSNITLADGIHSSYAAGPTDYERIFIAYPALKSLHAKTLQPDTILQPNQVLDGMIVSAFRVSKEEWAARKDLNFTFQFKNHPSLVLTSKAGITEQ